MLGLKIIRGGRELPEIACKNYAPTYDKEFQIVSVRTDNFVLPTTLISTPKIKEKIQDNLQNSTQVQQIRVNKKLIVNRIKVGTECSICYKQNYLKGFKCSHVLCMACIDELRNLACPVCREIIKEQLTEIQIEMIEFRMDYDIRETNRQIETEDAELARQIQW